MEPEATIVINGQECSAAEALTIRVALEALAFDVQEGALGDDEHGFNIANSYMHHIGTLREKQRNKR